MDSVKDQFLRDIIHHEVPLKNVLSWSPFLLCHKVKKLCIMISSLVIGAFSGLLWIIVQITSTDFLSSFIQLMWNQYLLYNHFISWPFLCSNKSNLTFSFILLPWDSIDRLKDMEGNKGLGLIIVKSVEDFDKTQKREKNFFFFGGGEGGGSFHQIRSLHLSIYKPS